MRAARDNFGRLCRPSWFSAANGVKNFTLNLEGRLDPQEAGVGNCRLAVLDQVGAGRRSIGVAQRLCIVESEQRKPRAIGLSSGGCDQATDQVIAQAGELARDAGVFAEVTLLGAGRVAEAGLL